MNKLAFEYYGDHNLKVSFQYFMMKKKMKSKTFSSLVKSCSIALNNLKMTQPHDVFNC